MSPWNQPFVDSYRLAVRSMLDLASERTLIPAVIPPGSAHIHTVTSILFHYIADLVRTLQGWLTLVVDSYVKTTGKAHLGTKSSASLPVMPFQITAAARVLGLVSLTTDYRNLWNAFVSEQFVAPWAKDDPRLDKGYFSRIKMPWQRQSGLRTDFERRQALIELDVLCAQELGLTLEQLRTIYRIQFPVLRANENDTWYDTMGRIVFSRKNGEGGLPRTKRPKDTAYGIKGMQSNIALGWEDVRHMKGGIVTYTYTDDTLPSGPFERTVEYHAPFDRCDREQDYAEAWQFFEREKSLGRI